MQDIRPSSCAYLLHVRRKPQSPGCCRSIEHINGVPDFGQRTSSSSDSPMWRSVLLTCCWIAMSHMLTDSSVRPRTPDDMSLSKTKCPYMQSPPQQVSSPHCTTERIDERTKCFCTLRLSRSRSSSLGMKLTCFHSIVFSCCTSPGSHPSPTSFVFGFGILGSVCDAVSYRGHFFSLPYTRPRSVFSA